MGKRVLVAEFMHETNTFSVQPTGLAEFQDGALRFDNEIPRDYRNTHSSMGAAFEAADTFGWTLAHPVVASANPSGRVTDEFFDDTCSRILDAAGQLDGVLLHLHGAMSVASYDDGEGELLQRLRGRIGEQIPVVVVLDLHATVTQQMADHASALIAYRTYPHIDQYERTWQGARLLARAMAGEITPRVALARRPILYALDGGRTNSAPMIELLRRADVIEADGQALVVSIQAGFSSADVHDIGPSVAVTIDGDLAAGQALAEQLMDYVWQERHYSTIHFTPMDEALRQAAQPDSSGTPLVISDYSDNPGAGAYGDSTTLLKAMVDADLQNVAFYAICDPEAAREAAAAGVGSTITLQVGGKIDPAQGGAPLALTGYVATITDGRFVAHGPMGGGVARNYGLSIVFRVGGIDIILISNNGQATDLGQLTSLGIDPSRKSTVAVKSMQHFRAAFEPIARQVLEVDAGALCTKDFKGRPYQHVRRPIWPLDDI
ncbi:M81 family metallopeptidase [Bordetella tumulicola]|uniref:M81 family metallopeptidase n=1 Tax=Bordetella tumulicola TaxID=1649133 RepID=UPI0039EF99AA